MLRRIVKTVRRLSLARKVRPVATQVAHHWLPQDRRLFILPRFHHRRPPLPQASTQAALLLPRRLNLQAPLRVSRLPLAQVPLPRVGQV